MLLQCTMGELNKDQIVFILMCSVAFFSSEEKAQLYVPEYATDCAVVASKTGKLSDLDTKAAIVAISTIAKETLVAA